MLYPVDVALGLVWVRLKLAHMGDATEGDEVHPELGHLIADESVEVHFLLSFSK